MSKLVPREVIENKILLIRGKKVMIDRDLAVLYGVETRVLNQAVKRNIERFPDDFMFHLNRDEIMRISQFVISLKFSKNVYAFTENGVAMLSSILKSKKAIEVNIQIMRVFTKLREYLVTHADLRRKIEEMEKKYDGQFRIVFDTIKELLDEPETKLKDRLGFHK